MRILLCHRPGGAFGYITDGWVNAIQHAGHEVARWNGDQKSWHDFDPDLYMGCSGHKQPIPRQRRAKVAIHVNPYNSIPGIDESPENIKWTVDMKPDAVYGYGDEADRHYWEGWTTTHGIQWVPMPTGGDDMSYSVVNTKKDYDVVYLGGRWAYKAKTIDKYLLPVLDKTNFKLHGWGDWPEGYCSGQLPNSEVSSFLGSGKIGPCVSEEHTHKYGMDIPERMYKVALCGSLIIHDNVPAVNRYIESAVVAVSPQDYLDLVMYYIENDDERTELIEKQRNEVLDKHTYHHRIDLLLDSLGMPKL